MSTATQPTVERRAQRQDDAQKVVRLSVNLAPSIAEILKSTAADQGLNITEGIRRAISLWKLGSDAQKAGQRVMIVEGSGDAATYREIVLV